MKKFWLLPLFVLLLLMISWLGSILCASILTTIFKNEFLDFEEYYVNVWGVKPQIRVISYTSKKATIYLYSDVGGEKIKLVKQDGEWILDCNIATWSDTGGSADDYFVWPYFKDMVF